MNAALLQVDGLCQRYGTQPVLHEVSLTLANGEILGLAGSSGSGKSTLARCIAGLQRYHSGHIVLAGQTLPALRRRRDFQRQAHILQMVFQDPQASVNPRWKLIDILTEPLARNISGQQRRMLAAQWLERVQLPPQWLERYPSALSGGQLQRLNIARALISQPRLLICDEALAALDVSTQAQIANLLKDIRDSLGTSLLFIGHDLAMMNFLCDRIAVMERGRIVECRPATELLQQPQHPHSQQLLALS